ncbi:MAG: HGGxSTG domain-containing protein [Brooklawnia sp.]|uniref:HGGxSTG domain-containing protein n=1 Tax=Brooklawnia sp. TaxID=2699740 RepID=UPI003C769381
MSQCKATNRQGNRCGRSAVPGATVCNMHGGKAPQVQAKAAERLLEAQATAYVQRFGGRTDIDPPTALLELVQAKRAEVGYWAEQLADREPESLIGAPELALLHKSQDQLASYSVGSLRAGVNGTTSDNAMQAARTLFTVMQRAIDQLGLTADQRQRALNVIARELDALVGPEHGEDDL